MGIQRRKRERERLQAPGRRTRTCSNRSSAAAARAGVDDGAPLDGERGNGRAARYRALLRGRWPATPEFADRLGRTEAALR